MVMSGGSRGIGLAIALAAARRGANIALLAKTTTPDPRLPGTIHTAAAEIEAAGGRALPVVGDVRSTADVERLVDQAVQKFGGIDMVVNNASAISLAGTLDLEPKRFHLMQEVNVRGTWSLTRSALPYLLKGAAPQVLTLSPPLNLRPHWLGVHPAYTVSKYGMTLLTLGWAEEFAGRGIGFNCLWPQTLINTAAVRNIVSGDGSGQGARSPEIMAEAAMLILDRDAAFTGRCEIDAEVLAEHGFTDLSRFGGGASPRLDLFVDE